MPGAYAHLTMVNLVKEPARLENQGFMPEAIVSVLDYFRFCELGAVSPDYPYLDIVHPNACHCADRMHYQRTGDMVNAGIKLKVGEYQKNKDKHRICEMHQDAYIFQRLNIGEIGLAEHLDSGIWGCCDKPGSGKLDLSLQASGRACLRLVTQGLIKLILL